MKTIEHGDKKIIAYGSTEDGAIEQAKNCIEDAEAFCLMADNHKGYGMPVGGVAVYKDKITPAGVGFDIACGNKAVRLDVKASDFQHEDLEGIAEQIWKDISFGVGQKNEVKVEHDLFNDTAWQLDVFKENPDLKKKAQSQLGTIGSGNHYIDIFKDEEDYIWVGVHFGSRGLGHTIASHFMKKAGDNLNIMDEKPHLLDVNSKEGRDYLQAMALAGRYAYAGRDWVCETVAKIIGGKITKEVHNHHNFAWSETHNGEDYWVVRKGATPAFPGQEGFIGGSMGDNAVIVKGIDSEASKETFYSTVHGAGRVMSRTQAAGKKRFRKEYRCGQRDCTGSLPFRTLAQNEEKPKCPVCGSKTNKWKGMKQISDGEIDMEEVRRMLVEKGIILKGAGADEAPGVYKKLPEVLKEHEGTIIIQHTLTPLVVCMADSDEFDPYKD